MHNVDDFMSISIGGTYKTHEWFPNMPCQYTALFFSSICTVNGFRHLRVLKSLFVDTLIAYGGIEFKTKYLGK